MHMHYAKMLSKVFVSSNSLRLLFMFMVRFTFTIFTHVILVHWRVILITCKMTCEEFTNYTQKSRIATEYGAHEYQNKTECTTATLYVVTTECLPLHMVHLFSLVYWSL